MPYPKQMQLLSRNPEILVATPGRLIDHMESGKIDFSELQMLVLDEADRMLDMGFIDDIEKIVAATPAHVKPCCSLPRWTALSATWQNASRRSYDHSDRSSATNMKTSSSAFTSWMICLKTVCWTICCATNRMDQAVVFTATKRDADTIADRLNIAGLPLLHCMATCIRARVTAR
jgi:superfamily II DNA/RNA helicase